MDKEIIQRYFLQVGRSFYTTDEFRRRFRFVPTSRFGLGFLSTFAVSDSVSVETFKPSSAANDGPIRLTLAGPRNYLLTERGTRRVNGTDIEVLLREPLKAGRLAQLVEGWCRRVEFPIKVDDLGNRSTVVAETPAQFVYDVQDANEAESRLIVRPFPINRPGIEGELYVFARLTSHGEAWDMFSWLTYTYPKTHPGAATPAFPRDVQCLHGITMDGAGHYAFHSGYSARVDYRGEGPSITLAREGQNRREDDPVIVSRWEEILRAHISSSAFSLSEDGWKYRQRLVDIFRLDSFWRSQEGMIPLRVEGNFAMFSLDVAERLPTLTIVLNHRRVNNKYSKEKSEPIPATKSENPELFHDRLLSRRHHESLINPRAPIRLSWLSEHYIAIDWSLVAGNSQPFAKITLSKWFLLELPLTTSIGCSFDLQGSEALMFLNTNNCLVEWLTRVKSACMNDHENLTIQQFNTVIELMEKPFRYGAAGYLNHLQDYLDAWSKLPDLPPELYPPELRLTADMFKLPHW